jgi:uncharacterized membrane protein
MSIATITQCACAVPIKSYPLVFVAAPWVVCNNKCERSRRRLMRCRATSVSIMGQLTEAAFAKAIAPCASCGATAFEVCSYIDRSVAVMLGDPNDDGKWAHDGEKFVDGTFAVTCVGCKKTSFASNDCPRCHAADTLTSTRSSSSNMHIPKRCPQCNGMEVTVTGFAPASVTTGGGGRLPTPTPLALVGDAGFHAAIIMCDECEWVAVADGCPLCKAPGPLRKRP